MEKVNDKLLIWGSEVDYQARQQASRASRLPFAAGHVALMPDAHVGIGATVGSVIPTTGAVVPSFAGVDLGCGMIATETTYIDEDRRAYKDIRQVMADQSDLTEVLHRLTQVLNY